jgi:hypothetical protein
MTPSPTQYLFEDMSLRGAVPHVALAHAYLMPALLPEGDEFPMNFEGLGVSFRDIYRFPQQFLSWG